MRMKSLAIGISIVSVMLLTLTSLTNVVGYQTVKSNVISDSIAKMQIEPGYVNWTVNGTMGKNDWYISPITLTCTYDHDVYAHVYYGYENYSGEYTEPITIENQGYISFIFSAVDYEGNIEKVGEFWFNIDYSIPEIIDLSVEKIGVMKWLFSVTTEDSFSGINNVEFYLDDQFLGNVHSAPFEWIWTGCGNHTVRAISYDFAGLNASSTTNTPYEVQSSSQIKISNEVNQIDLLFQTICDIVNNKEMQRLVLTSQMSRGIFTTSEFPLVTKNQIRQIYFLGLILSKIMSNSRMQSLIVKHHLMNPEIQPEILALIEKNSLVQAEITQVKSSECDCKNENTKVMYYPIICSILLSLYFIGLFLFYSFRLGVILVIVADVLLTLFQCINP